MRRYHVRMVVVKEPARKMKAGKSPLRSEDEAYINGFGLGIGFVFFMLAGFG
jgi:hypothetical protein